MRVLDELGQEIERVANAAGDVRRRRRWWRPGVLFTALPLCLGTVAVAATTGLLQGEPVRNPPDVKLNPKEGRGVTVDSGRLFDLRVADPAGGLPWGLRVVETSRGLGCVQVGRVSEGKLGVLGRDGAFGDDGRFHERGAEVVQQSECQLADGAGHVFIAVGYSGLPASGDSSGCDARGDDGTRRACPAGSLRDVYYGLLGPEATAITYEDADGQVVREPVQSPEGAYLLVKPTPPGRRRVGQYMVGVSPASGLRSVEYRDGSTCRRRKSGVLRCPLKGLVMPRLETATREEVAAPVRVRVGQRPEWPGGDKRLPAQRRITFSFRARRAADAREYYTFEATVTQSRPVKGCFDGALGGAIAKDLAAGSEASRVIYLPYVCRGRVKIRVGYAQERKPNGVPFGGAGRANDWVDVASAEIP
ncbi:hypothetical protein C8N24_0584 [Solirubrobacter pauli]|uniref:Uncharacterized protein n=1 Tax=Solirubrobacter pauli TaxID=166793 RepID=A0A660LDH6_9ACTN|nr:hypothetical protein [Solirubrobacter pauli]RKQ90771.1 hypothetical protein C8N24_0584 [Solirubrobacter pauli]